MVGPEIRTNHPAGPLLEPWRNLPNVMKGDKGDDIIWNQAFGSVGKSVKQCLSHSPHMSAVFLHAQPRLVAGGCLGNTCPIGDVR